MSASHFAARLKELREEKGWTQQQLAERAGVAKATVADLEQERYAPTWPTVVALADALGVGCEDFRHEPAVRPPTTRGRPRRTAEQAAESLPSMPRGRPKTKPRGPKSKGE